jgi:hypothetical protein
MLFNIGYTNTAVIYSHSTVITKVMLLYNTEWQYAHGMAVNYRGKKFYNIGLLSQCYKTFLSVIYVFSYLAIEFAFGKYCQPILMFVGKARSLHLSGASERCIIHLGSNLTSKH